MTVGQKKRTDAFCDFTVDNIASVSSDFMTLYKCCYFYYYYYNSL